MDDVVDVAIALSGCATGTLGALTVDARRSLVGVTLVSIGAVRLAEASKADDAPSPGPDPAVLASLATLCQRTPGEFGADTSDGPPEFEATGDRWPVECRRASEFDPEFATDEFDESDLAVSAKAIPGVLVATAVPIPNATANPPTRPTYIA